MDEANAKRVKNTFNMFIKLVKGAGLWWYVSMGMARLVVESTVIPIKKTMK